MRFGRVPRENIETPAWLGLLCVVELFIGLDIDAGLAAALQLHSTLKYLQSSAGVLEFTTNCDLFVYLNGERIINLGGVHLAQSASIVLNQVTWIHGCRLERPGQAPTALALSYIYII